MKTTECPKKTYLALILSALLVAHTATAEEFDFLGVGNETAPQTQTKVQAPPQPTKPATPVSDVESLANDENSVLALDTALFDGDADEVMSDYIKDLEDAQTARESATDVLSQRPQKLLIKIKPHAKKETSQETETPDDETSQEAIEDEMTSPLADEKETSSDAPVTAESEIATEAKGAAEPQKLTQSEAATEAEPVDTPEKTAETPQTATAPQPTAASEPSTDTPQSATQQSPASAPFGLTWGASKQELEATHPILEKAERDGYQNVWRLSSNAQSASFAEVVLIFGTQDKLWCIYAESKPQPDDAHASKILALYHKYYDALSKKYGHAEETFVPAENQTEKTDKDGKTETVLTYGTLGDENFLADLEAEKTSLYATFYDDEIGATLSIAAQNNQTYLVLDYKNLPLMNAEKKQKINSLIQDLEGL